MECVGVAMGERIQEVLALSGTVREAAAGAGDGRSGRQFAVTVLSPGRALSGRVYTPEACRQLVPLLQGARAFADHLTKTELHERSERSIRDIVGFYHSPHVGTDGEACATLQVLENATWLGEMLADALANGRGDLVGISVDALVDVERQAGKPPTVLGIEKLLSADVVTRPSAGGRIERVVQSDRGDGTGEGTDVEQEQGGQGVTGGGTAVAERTIEATRTEVAQLQAELTRQREELAHERRVHESGRVLEAALTGATLPAPVLSLVRNRFSGRVFEQAELDAELNAHRAMLADLTQSGVIRGMGYERSQVTDMRSARERLQESFDALFDVTYEGGVVKGGRKAGVRTFESLREAYASATGDHEVKGFGPTIRALESERMTEADQTTASFSYLLGTSMNRKLLAEYQSWPAEWQKWATVVPIKDFKQQQRVRLGAFGSLSTVAEDAPYTALTLSDTQATYSATKRGNLVQITRETIVNDDLQGIKQIPTKLAISAAYTLAEFVYGFVLSSNLGTIYDGLVLFENTVHNNRGTGLALTSANVQTGVIAMRKQANSAGKKLGIRPTFLIVPPELEFTALTIIRSAGVPGSANNDINPMMGYMDVIVVPQIANAAQWMLSADPRIVDTVEVGFVGGQVNPELFIQDNPLYGLNFTQDVISYKVRHEYGGAVVDYRGVYSGF